MSDTLQVVCPHCDAVNRVPAGRLDQSPSCGKCHRRLFEGSPLALDASRFERHLAHSGLPLLVDFWAPWCGPCRMMAPAFEQAATRLEPRMRLVKVDTEAAPALAQRYAIRSIPTLAMFGGGRELARRSGAIGAADIERWARAQAG